MPTLVKSSLLAAMCGLSMLALAVPASAQAIVIDDLDKTQAINLLLTLVRVEIAAANCPGVEVEEQHTSIVHDKLGAVATKLDYDSAMIDGTFIARAQGLYDADNAKFCATWAPQVRPVAVALLE